MSRAAERSRSSTGGILLDGGPFDCAQGALAKAIVILDADNRVTFATRIAGAILERFHRDADPSTALREPGAKAIVILDADNRITFATRIAEGNSWRIS